MSNISIFGAIPQGGQHKAEGIITIDDLLNSIKYGKWQKEIEAVRLETDKAKRNELKKFLKSVTISGTFAIRKQDNLLEHSGFICIDIDNFTDKKALEADQYSHAVFSSASGNGIAVLVKIDKSKHKESFNWLRNYYFSQYGIVVDSAPQNVASLRFVSYDPNLFINEKSKKSSFKEIKLQKPKSLPVILGDDSVSDLVKQVNCNIADSYDEYLRLGFAICSGFGEYGRQWFHSLSSHSSKYDSAHCDKQYDICLKGAGKSGIGVGTFYFMLKEAGVVFPKQDNSTIRDVAVLKKDNTRKEDAVLQLVQLKGIETQEAERIVNEVYEREDIDLASMASDPEKLIESLMAWLNQNQTIKKNAITGYYEEGGNNLSKEALNGIYLRARTAFNSPNVTYDLVERLIFSPFTTEYNPITAYINKNLHRNKDGQIKTLIDTINSDTWNYHIYIRKWMLSLIAAYEGHPVRSVLSLVGGQGTGKSEWFRRLLPEGLKKYYAESKLDAGKDDDILMCQKLIVMDDEMGGKSKQDEKRFKELTSKSIFSLRAPYGRTNEDFKRLAVLCGTSNDPAVINDPTGNTRILPINVISINHELFNSIDKDELFMECYRAYMRGDEWQLNRSEFADLSELTTDFEAIPVERELIMLYFASKSDGTPTGVGKKYLTASQIKMHIEIASKQQIKNVKIFGAELKRLFGASISKRIDNQVLKVYPVFEVNNSQGFKNESVEEEIPF
jgi:hypothetical protein